MNHTINKLFKSKKKAINHLRENGTIVERQLYLKEGIKLELSTNPNKTKEIID